jgi:hypothetical protein
MGFPPRTDTDLPQDAGFGCFYGQVSIKRGIAAPQLAIQARASVLVLYMSRLVENRWFIFGELIWFSTAAIIWALIPQLGWRLLPLALLPWVVRLLARRFPFKRTYFDLLLLLFALTAFMGVWAAYDKESALAKFWLLVAGILLFYSLAGQPRDNLWLVAGLISAIGVGVSVFFLLTQDWLENPAKINLVQQAAAWWMGIRPNLLSGQIHHNIAGGMMAITMPFLIPLGLNAWRGKMVLALLYTFMAGVLLATGLLFTTSRGAWIGLAAGLGVWVLWMLSGKAAARLGQDKYVLFGIGLMASAVLVLGVIGFYPGLMMGLAGEMPGPDSAASRLDLAQNGAKLVGDFIFTGGGLGAFSGLYSRYILDIPFFFFDYSHNLLLDIVIEQSFLALFAFGFIYLSTILIGIRSLRDSSNVPLILASLAGIIAIFVHGLVDNIIYYQWGSLLVFIIPAFMLSITQVKANQNNNEGRLPEQRTSTQASRFGWRILGIAGTASVVVMLAIFGFAYRQAIMSAWNANLGAVEMARVELAGFPSEQWEDGTKVVSLGTAEVYFRRALAQDAINRTANHRLGLIAMQRRDFSTAVSYLETALWIDGDHRGIFKSLGYAYAWSGDFDQATPLLAKIPEARQELNTYIWWWGTQGRDDLAENANHMLVSLDSKIY